MLEPSFLRGQSEEDVRSLLGTPVVGVRLLDPAYDLEAGWRETIAELRRSGEL